MAPAFLPKLRLAAISAGHALRLYYMFAFSGIALLLAVAVALGAFGFTDQKGPARRVATSTDLPAVVARAPVAPLVLTYYLVASEAQQALMYSLEDQLWNREWLQSSKIEVLVARDSSEEEAAYREIAAARVRSSLTRVVVEDLRAR